MILRLKILLPLLFFLIVKNNVGYCQLPNKNLPGALIEFLNPDERNLEMYFNGRKVALKDSAECLLYTIYSNGIVQIENRVGRQKQWSNISLNIKQDQYYVNLIIKKGK